MRNPKVDPWELKLLREQEQFSKGWDWGRVLLHWRSRIDEFGIDLDPVFREITVHDPAGSRDREPALSWWPVREIETLKREIQEHFERWPGTVGPVHPNSTLRRGEEDTLLHLWESKEDADKVAGVLVSGSLFARIESRRVSRSIEKWPPYNCVRVLQDWAYDCWRDEGTQWGWHPSCTSVLPVSSHDYVYTIDSMESLVRYIAEEHAMVFATYRPVVIRYANQPEPILRSVA